MILALMLPSPPRGCERIDRAPSYLAPLAGRGRNRRVCARIPGEGQRRGSQLQNLAQPPKGPSPRPSPRKRGEGELCGLCCWRRVHARQADRELGELADPAVDRDRAAVLLGDDVPADRQPEAGAFAGRLGGEERLKQFVPDLGRDADAVVADADFDRLAEIVRRRSQGRLERRVASLLLALGGGVKTVAEQVEADAGHLLRRQLDRRDARAEIALQGDVELL